jgi:hypothetical protein
MGGTAGKIKGLTAMTGKLGTVFKMGGKLLGGALSLVGGLPGALLFAGLSFAGPIWDMVKKFWGGDKPQEKLKKAAKYQLEAARKSGEAADKQLQAAKKTREAAQFSSASYGELMDRAEKLADFTPALVKWTSGNAIMSALSRGAKAGKFTATETTQIANMQYIYGKVKALHEKSLKGEITPDEHKNMVSMAKVVRNNMMHFKMLYPKLFSDKLMKGMTENVLQQLIKAGSPESRAYAEDINFLRGGKSVTDEYRPSNWDPETGRYRWQTSMDPRFAKPGNIFQETRGMLPMQSGSEKMYTYFNWREQEELAKMKDAKTKGISHHGQIKTDSAMDEVAKLAKGEGLRVYVVNAATATSGGMSPAPWANNPLKSRVE